MSNSWRPHGLYSPWNSRPEYWSGYSFPSPGDLPNPEIKPRSPTLQADSLLSEPPGKPKNTGVVSLSLLQGNFPNQESNQDLLHCRQILYQLSYQGSPRLDWGGGALCVPKSNKNVLVKQNRTQKGTEKKALWRQQRLESSHLPRDTKGSARSHQKPGEGHGMGPHHHPERIFRRNRLCQHLDFGLLASRTTRE